LTLSDDAFMRLLNSRRQSFDNRFKALENLLGLPAGPISGLPVFIEQRGVPAARLQKFTLSYPLNGSLG